MDVALFTVKEAAVVPPKSTTVAPVKLVPVMVTTVPGLPLVGVIDVMVGAGMKVKLLALVAVPPGVVTLMVPVEPLPTVGVIDGGVDRGERSRCRAAKGDRGRAGEVRAGDGHLRTSLPPVWGERGDCRRRGRK